jgi:hypothetical protein
MSMEAAHCGAISKPLFHPVLQVQRVLGNRAVTQLMHDAPVMLNPRLRNFPSLFCKNTKPFMGLPVDRSLSQPLTTKSPEVPCQGGEIGPLTKSYDGILQRQSEPTTPEKSSDIESTGNPGARQSHLTTAAAWLVSNPAEWETSRLAMLDIGVAIDVIDLAASASFNRCDEKYQWWKIRVLSGRANGSVGWVMRTFLTENRTQPKDVEIWAAVQRLVARGKHWEAIDLVIMEYGIDTRDATFKYEPRLSVAGDANGNVTPMVVRIGPAAFTSLAKLARVIVHELEHIRQFQEGMESGGHEYDLGQFLSECAEMTATGVAEYTFADFMKAAEMASRYWYALGQTSVGLAQQEEHWDTFVATRKVIHSRYAEADPDSRTKKHERILKWYDAQKNPAPPPPP